MKYYDETNSPPSIETLTNVSVSRSVVSLKIYNQEDQNGSNGCSQSVCQHLCLPRPPNNYTCACTLGYILENETECKEDLKKDKVIHIIYVKKTLFRFIILHKHTLIPLVSF